MSCFVMSVRLQALRVVVSVLDAGSTGDTSGRSSVADSTALAPFLDNTARRAGRGGPRAGSCSSPDTGGGSGPCGGAGARRPGGGAG